jgi:N-dimethylarginine dimethylaminohydrolase
LIIFRKKEDEARRNKMKQNAILKKNNKEIITILEMPELYTDVLVKSAEQEFHRRNILKEELMAIAEELFRKRCVELFEERSIPVDDYDLPTSLFLEEEGREIIIVEEFERMKERRKLFNTGLPRP